MTNPESQIATQTPEYEVLKISVRALLVVKNVKQIDIARQFSIDPSEINKVVRGSRTTPHIREAIAKALNMKLEEIWSWRETTK